MLHAIALAYWHATAASRLELVLKVSASDFSLPPDQHHESQVELNLFLQRQPSLLPRLPEKYPGQ
ncbi:hypothetical protein [Undibacterium sp. TS12]|uniref:hypothetical protein n=1 Tax=Undibacterium sp. TS12 TaxID=2908202 RepID=UPI001F4CD728|nr:hypothetical protein [Undibacterium sp. TS12]MCH8618222.1 hypothetical protein [Undibacterium sp. TS12]